MSETDRANPRRSHLTFFGKIVAGQSHEVTNVLNIINEITGLQGDLILAGGGGKPVDFERLGDLGLKVQRQVERGEKILRNINRFAHSVDLPISVFDIREALTNILFLARRWTTLRKVELKGRFPEETAVIESNPFLFKQAVFLGIDMFLETAASMRTIAVGYRIGPRTVHIPIEGDGNLPAYVKTDSRFESLQILVAELGGRLDVVLGNDHPGRLDLEIPLHHPVIDETESDENRRT